MTLTTFQTAISKRLSCVHSVDEHTNRTVNKGEENTQILDASLHSILHEQSPKSRYASVTVLTCHPQARALGNQVVASGERFDLKTVSLDFYCNLLTCVLGHVSQIIVAHES